MKSNFHSYSKIGPAIRLGNISVKDYRYGENFGA